MLEPGNIRARIEAATKGQSRWTVPENGAGGRAGRRVGGGRCTGTEEI